MVVVERIVKANKREVPPGLPPLVWADRVDAHAEMDLSWVPWWDDLLEYLEPRELRRMKAKALVWLEETGSWPKDVNCWWEIRQGRKAGFVPLRQKLAGARIDGRGTLHCGECAAKWSQDEADGGHPGRCKLCGCRWHVIEDEREELPLIWPWH